VVKVVLISLIAASLAVIAYISPPIGASLVVVGLSAYRLRLLSENNGEPAIPAADPIIDNPTSTADSGAALDQARRELGIPLTRSSDPIELQTAVGKVRLSSGHRNQTPFINVQWFTGEETEMTFIVRRKQSLLGLAKLVDNTPVHGSRIEYRLRAMELPPSLAETYHAGSSRPRLFRELLNSGVAETLRDGLFDPSYRLEELAFTGTSLTAIYVPAASPATAPWARDALERASGFLGLMQSFLANAFIPSAQG